MTRRERQIPRKPAPKLPTTTAPRQPIVSEGAGSREVSGKDDPMGYMDIAESSPRVGAMLDGLYVVALAEHLADGIHKVLATVDYRDRTEWILGTLNGHTGKFRVDRGFDTEAMALTVYVDYDGSYTLRDGSKAVKRTKVTIMPMHPGEKIHDNFTDPDGFPGCILRNAEGHFVARQWDDARGWGDRSYRTLQELLTAVSR